MNEKDADVLAELEKYFKQANEMMLYQQKGSLLLRSLFEPFRNSLKTFLEENNLNVNIAIFMGNERQGISFDPHGLATNLENFIKNVKSGR